MKEGNNENTLRREIVVNEHISILINVSDRIDLYEANAEANLINKITRAIESAGEIRAIENGEKRQRYEIFDDEKKKEIVSEYAKADKEARHRLAERLGMSQKQLQQRVHYYKGLPSVKTTSTTIKIKPLTKPSHEWTKEQVKKLLSLKAQGKSLDEMAKILAPLTRKQIDNKLRYEASKGGN